MTFSAYLPAPNEGSIKAAVIWFPLALRTSCKSQLYNFELREEEAAVRVKPGGGDMSITVYAGGCLCHPPGRLESQQMYRTHTALYAACVRVAHCTVWTLPRPMPRWVSEFNS